MRKPGTNIEERVKQFNRKRELIQKMQGTPMKMKDSTGREVKKGDLVHIPTSAVPSPVLVGEIVEVIEAGVIKVPGQPPLPARVVIQSTIMVGPDANGIIPYMYTVGSKKLREVEPEQPAKVIEGLEAEDPMNTETQTATPLASEALPEGIELTDA